MRKTISGCLLIIILSSSATASATAPLFNRWTSNGPYGGEVRALVIDPKTPTTIYAGAQFGGIFKSIDSETSWRKLDLNLPQSTYAIQINNIAVDPVNPSNVYAGLYHYGIVKSTDGGENWSQINTGLSEMNVRSIAVDPSCPFSQCLANRKMMEHMVLKPSKAI